MNNKWKVSLSTGAAALMMICVSGCGTGSTENSTSPSNGPGTASSGATQGQPLVMSTGPKGSFTDNFNPFSTTPDDGTQGLIYEPLFVYNTIGPQVYPVLGRSFAWRNGNKTLTVQLNTSAKWQDGQSFTSKDVVFTFNLLKKYPAADLNGVWQKLSSVTAQGDGTVVFNFKNPDVPFAYYVLQTYIVPEHIWSSVGDPTKYTNGNPVGTGPFELESFSSQEYKLKANSNYYGGKVPVPEIDFPAYNGNDSNDLALAQGQIDWDGVFIPNIDKTYVAVSSHNKYWFPPNNINDLIPNLKDPNLGNLAVRRAISMAINRVDTQNKAEYGYEKVASPDGILPTMSDWVDPNMPSNEQQFTFDPSGAEQILQQAGYKKNSAGIYTSPSGVPLNFTLLAVAGWTDQDESAQLISQDLSKIGISVNVQQVQYGDYMAKLTSHNFQMALGSSQNGPNPYYIFQNLLQTGAQFNYEQFSDPTVDNALADFAKTTDVTQQKKDIYSIEQAFAAKLPVISLVYGATWFEYNDSKYTGWPSSSNPYATPAPWSVPDTEIVVMHLKPTQ